MFKERLTAFLTTHDLVSGIGTPDAPCSIAAINLVMTGELSDDIPDCMSEIIGKWIITIQDAMPSSIRNSARWKTLLQNATGTGRADEIQRLEIVLNWMWCEVLPSLQNVANINSFGNAWANMCEMKTPSAAADAAAYAAYAAAYAAYAADAGRAASDAGRAASDATRAAAYASYAADAGRAASDAAADASDAARAAASASAAAYAADAAASASDFWNIVDPCALLEKLINLGA